MTDDAIRLTIDSDACPYCGANLVAGPIPESERGLFGGRTHFGHMIVRNCTDGSNQVICPDCGREDEL